MDIAREDGIKRSISVCILTNGLFFGTVSANSGEYARGNKHTKYKWAMSEVFCYQEIKEKEPVENLSSFLDNAKKKLEIVTRADMSWYPYVVRG